VTQAKRAPRGFRQARCQGCGLTPALCLCSAWPALQAPFEVSVVMSRAEARAASNSGRLAALWLSGARCHVQGQREAEAGLRDPAQLLRPGSALLFPGGNAASVLPHDVQHLIVPDGTWSQALRIERRWFAAAALPRVSLDAGWASAYGLRRAGREPRAQATDPRGTLCTFEAIAIALAVLGQPELASHLLGRFAEWARRARWLKSGGFESGAAAPSAPPLERPEHPALARLRALRGR
jgi:DTW domain-containing protein